MEDIIEGIFHAVKWIIRGIVWLILEALEWVVDLSLDIFYEKIPKKYRWLFWLTLAIMLIVIMYFIFTT